MLISVQLSTYHTQVSVFWLSSHQAFFAVQQPCHRCVYCPRGKSHPEAYNRGPKNHCRNIRADMAAHRSSLTSLHNNRCGAGAPSAMVIVNRPSVKDASRNRLVEASF